MHEYSHITVCIRGLGEVRLFSFHCRIHSCWDFGHLSWRLLGWRSWRAAVISNETILELFYTTWNQLNHFTCDQPETTMVDLSSFIRQCEWKATRTHNQESNHLRESWSRTYMSFQKMHILCSCALLCALSCTSCAHSLCSTDRQTASTNRIHLCILISSVCQSQDDAQRQMEIRELLQLSQFW